MRITEPVNSINQRFSPTTLPSGHFALIRGMINRGENELARVNGKEIQFSILGPVRSAIAGDRKLIVQGLASITIFDI